MAYLILWLKENEHLFYPYYLGVRQFIFLMYETSKNNRAQKSPVYG